MLPKTFAVTFAAYCILIAKQYSNELNVIVIIQRSKPETSA